MFLLCDDCVHCNKFRRKRRKLEEEEKEEETDEEKFWKIIRKPKLLHKIFFHARPLGLRHDGDIACKLRYPEALLYSPEKMQCTAHTVYRAAQDGSLDILRFMYENHRKEFDQVCVADLAAKYGHVHILEWLREHGLLNFLGPVMDEAEKNGHYDVAVWLYQNIDMKPSLKTLIGAAEKGRVSVVKAVLPLFSYLDKSAALVEAAKNDRLEVVRLLYDKECGGANCCAMYEAALRGHTKVIQWFCKECGETPPVTAAVGAAMNARWRTAEYVCKKLTCHQIGVVMDRLVIPQRTKLAHLLGMERVPGTSDKYRYKTRARLNPGERMKQMGEAICDARASGDETLAVWLEEQRDEKTNEVPRLII